MNTCVSSVGAGAPGGLDAIRRSACSSTGERSSSPDAPFAKILPSMPSEAMTVTHWYKQNVYDPSDAKIGDIMDVLVDRGGKIVARVVSAGGFLGMGEKDVVVPFNAVQFKTKDNNKWYPVMNTTKDALKNAPGYKYDHTAMTWVPENSPATTGSPTPAPRSNAR
jgi:sporulation protein YlmC with PRC-barrel domain